MSDYAQWIETKARTFEIAGLDVGVGELNEHLFGFQRDLVWWALSRGRAAIFADTGLGKTLMQTAWAHEVAQRMGRVLILAPLAVANQTVDEAARFGIACEYARHDTGGAIVVTNYEMLKHFDPSDFAGVVLDESSILKAYDGKTRSAIIGAFARTPMRLACTATPAPNDHTELGNHAEFLGVLSRSEMLAEYFCHDGGKTQDWRLKGHARSLFWRWVCSWAAVVRKPSDLGYDDDGFILPRLVQQDIRIESSVDTAWKRGMLVPVGSNSLHDQRASRRETMSERVAAIADSIATEQGEAAIVWCDYNAESSALAAAIPGAVEVKGSDSHDAKREALLGFSRGDIRVLVTKASIAGFGMNWQHCARVYFVGPNNSYEQTYQSIRRCWRFGQQRSVIVRTCVADEDGPVVANVRRKAADAERMARMMVAQVGAASYRHGTGARRQWCDYEPTEDMEIQAWLCA